MTPVKSVLCFFFSSRRRHTRYWRDWSSDVCSSDLGEVHSPLDSTHVASAVGINLVTSVVRVEGHRLWVLSTSGRSEERRVGKECRSGWSPDHYEKKKGMKDYCADT